MGTLLSMQEVSSSFDAMDIKHVAPLANAIEKQLTLMGDDAKGISWFSSCAEEYAAARMARVA